MFIRLALISLFTAMTAFSQMPPLEPGVSHDLAKWRAARYSDVRYKLNLTLEKMSPVLKGTIEIRVKVGEKGSGGVGANKTGTQAPSPAYAGSSGVNTPIILDWREIKGHEKLSTITKVSINDNPLIGTTDDSFKVQDALYSRSYKTDREHLIFRDGVVAGENVIKLDFTSPILTSGSAITRYVDKEDGAEYIYSLFVPSDASTAFPVFDQPDLKARFTLGINTPVSWNVVTNSAIKIHTRYDLPDCINCGEDRNIDEYSETKPISTYVFAFAAGPFERVSEPPAIAGGLTRSTANVGKTSASASSLQPPATAGGTDKNGDVATSIFVRKSQAAKFMPHAAEVFRLNREGIKYLETYFDYKFPFPKYDIVLIPEFPFGGMEHAGATFLREASVIFPQEPTKSDLISRANVIFHEAAHQWFGDTVTMKWFDDLWLKEGFAEFMAYKTLEKVMPEMNAWKAFYERNKQAAYLTDSTKGTTPIYQEIANLNSAKSAYGNIVYRKAPSFLKQAEFYLGPDKFQTAVRAFLKKHEYANAGWEDLVSDFARAKCGLPERSSTVDPSQILCAREVLPWADAWIKQRGVPIIKWQNDKMTQTDSLVQGSLWSERLQLYQFTKNPNPKYADTVVTDQSFVLSLLPSTDKRVPDATFLFPNYGDYGYGIFLLDDKSRDYVLKNIQNEKDEFLRSMMWGSLWDSVREGEMHPREYIELVIKNVAAETDETIVQSILSRASTAMGYYLPMWRKASVDSLRPRFEAVLIERMRNAPTNGQRITFYRALLNNAASEDARNVLKRLFKSVPPASAGGVDSTKPPANAGGTDLPLRAKDRFDIVTRLAVLNDPEAPRLLEELVKSDTSDDAKRYAYAARAAFPTKENREKFWNDFVSNKEISESWIEAAAGPFNSVMHDELSLPYLERALKELPNLKRTRKIFFINNWLGAFIGGQRSEEALAIINKFLGENPKFDKDLRLKILENSDLIERAVRIREKYKNH